MTDKNAKNENSKIRIMTFFPPFIILVAFLVLSLVDQETFLGVINNINNWIIKNLGWAASILALAIVIVAVVAMFSKFGDDENVKLVPTEPPTFAPTSFSASISSDPGMNTPSSPSSRTFMRGCTSMRRPTPALGNTPSIFPGVGPMNPAPPQATNPR